MGGIDMLAILKRSIFRAYCWYEDVVPVHIGKYRLAQLLHKVFGYAIFTVDGFKMELDPLASLDKTLIRTGLHDETVAQCIREAGAGTFLDVGANIGYFSLFAGCQGMRVIAFEPSPRELRRLHRNVALNDARAIVVYPFGLSQKEEQLRLRLGVDGNPGTNSVLETEKSDHSVNCDFAPLSYFVTPAALEDVRVCKIDVEGFEMSVLRGMEESMSSLKNAVFVVEIAPAYLAKNNTAPRDIYDFFEKHGYAPRIGFGASGRYDEVFRKV